MWGVSLMRAPRLGGTLLLAVMLSASLLAGSAQAQDTGPLLFDEYWQQIEQTAAAVEGIAQADSAAIRTVLDEQAALWEAVREVQLPDGTVVPVDSSYLVGLLRDDLPDLARLEAHLDAMLASEPTESTILRPEDVPLGEILARREFQWEEEPPNPIREWLNVLLERLAALFGGGIPLPFGIGRLFIPIGLLLLALIVAYALRSLLVDLVQTADVANDSFSEAAESLTADAALKRAQEVSASGDYRSAVRYLYLSSLLLLEERGLLNYDRTRTNREYLRSVSHKPELASILRDVVDVFDRVWYGFQALDDASYAEYSERVMDLRRQR